MNIYPKKFTKKFTKKFGHIFISFFINQKTRNPMSTAVSQNSTYDDGTMVPIGETCEVVSIKPEKHESIKVHKGPFKSGKLLKNSSLRTGDGDERFSYYPDCSVQLDNGEIVKSNFDSSPNVMMPGLLFKVIPKPTDDVFAPKVPAALAPAAVAPAAPAAVPALPGTNAKKRGRDDAEDDEDDEDDADGVEANKANKCSEKPTLFGTVPPECVQPKKVALETVVENAVDAPFELLKDAAAEGIVDLFKSSGNTAIAEILTKEALPQLTGPDGKLLTSVITDPAVAKEFDTFTNNLSGIIGNSFQKLGDDIQKPLNEAVETAIEGGISTATHAAANAPGVGAIVTIAEGVGTINKLKDEVGEIVGAVENAKMPIDAAMKDIVPLSKAIDEAATAAENAQAAAAGAVAGATNAAASGVAGVAAGVNDAAASGVAGVAAGVNDAIPNVEIQPIPIRTDEEVKELGKKRGRESGGSRKRRRIHKLSRRIERTLRRVQKKHGLRDDKNSFLRRTLNAKNMK